MSDLHAAGPVKRVQIEATVIRADGRVERLGVISDSKWRWWDPRRWSADRRIHQANERRDA